MTVGSTLPDPAPPRWSRRGAGVVAALAAVALLVIGATVGLAIGGSGGRETGLTSIPAEDSVDVGFLRDMSVHHEQGVLMAHIQQQNPGGSDVVDVLAYDIEYQQTSQIGLMSGFLLLWDHSLNNPRAPMEWMTDHAGHGSGEHPLAPDSTAGAVPMPGMATRDEVERLKTLSGTDSDVYFLQLMHRHHAGGVPMMEYAAQNAVNPAVRTIAAQMVAVQGAEMASMEQSLAQLGAEPLPFP